MRAWIEAGAPREGKVPGDDGQPLRTSGSDEDVVLPPPERGIQIAVTAPAIPIGTEETACHYLKLPSDVDFDVDRIQIAVSGGSHHIHLYRPFDPSYQVPDGFEVCNAAVDFNVWELVAATQLPRSDWELPEGVAYHFRAGEQVLVQTHFVNVGSLATEGDGHVLHEPERGRARIGRPLRRIALRSGPRRLRARAEHAHAVRRLQIPEPDHADGDDRPLSLPRPRPSPPSKLDVNGNPTDEIYHHEGYDDPLFITYDGPTAPQFAPGEGLRWTCTWDEQHRHRLRVRPVHRHERALQPVRVLLPGSPCERCR